MFVFNLSGFSLCIFSIISRRIVPVSARVDRRDNGDVLVLRLKL